MTILNIGTDKGNLTGIAFKKELSEISVTEVFEKAKKLLQTNSIRISGWADVTHEYFPENKPNLSEIRNEIREHRNAIRNIMDDHSTGHLEHGKLKEKIEGIDIALQVIEKYIIKP